MELPANYNAQEVEDKWYQYWIENGYFYSKPNHKKPYTIVIPPPNVTGVLHMGHILNNTIQDVLIRRARLKGFNACWVPGTDHASIATENKVVHKLKEQGLSKKDLTRDEFLGHAWDWTDQHRGIILNQLKKIGASCDWKRTTFTMDESLNKSVTKVFIDLFKKGLIYRSNRMVNWDPLAKTTLSDEEVIHKEVEGKLYYIRYEIEDSNDSLIIATTRPETIFGDVAVCIHPEDKRYKHLIGKQIKVPVVNRWIPIIEDDYIDIEFGTGCLKVTPAHDQNDKQIGEKHQLEVIDVFNEDGTLNNHGLHYEGKDRFIVRKEIVAELASIEAIEKTENHTHKVATSERSGAVIEPRISLQWFLKMDTLVKPAITHTLNETAINFFPKKYINLYRHWLENIKDWNISRQLWWGHRIPVYYYGKNIQDFVVADTVDEALELANEKAGKKITTEDLRQEEDVLDTWFSAWLWPISVFDGINNPENEEINYYYPTQDLVTGPDIIFFWVARMIFSGYEFRQEKPFKNVYFTGIVRDKMRRKMSKSLGNSPDPLTLIKEYGADGVRVGMLLCASAGNDLLFETDLCVQGRNFVTKIWNVFRLVKGWKVDDKLPQTELAKTAVAWYDAKFQKTLSEIEKSFESYRISESLMIIYKHIWNDFSSWYLEMVKPDYQQSIDAETYKKTIEFLEDNLKILHPFMPFITEEIWHQIAKREPEEALIISMYPEQQSFDRELVDEFKNTSEIISEIRRIRKEQKINYKTPLPLFVINKENFSNRFDEVLKKLTNISSISIVNEELKDAISFRIKTNTYFVEVLLTEDNNSIEKIKEELLYAEKFLVQTQRKLTNEKFMNNAPESIVAIEKKKEADTLAKIEILKAGLKG